MNCIWPMGRIAGARLLVGAGMEARLRIEQP